MFLGLFCSLRLLLFFLLFDLPLFKGKAYATFFTFHRGFHLMFCEAQFSPFLRPILFLGNA
jgi:hypothetical protein